jgi:DNA-binding transcriptional LysR family regulator
MGISILSHWAVAKIDPRRRLKALKLDAANTQRFFYVIYPRQKARRKSVNYFLDFIKEYKG